MSIFGIYNIYFVFILLNFYLFSLFFRLLVPWNLGPLVLPLLKASKRKTKYIRCRPRLFRSLGLYGFHISFFRSPFRKRRRGLLFLSPSDRTDFYKSIIYVIRSLWCPFFFVFCLTPGWWWVLS